LILSRALTSERPSRLFDSTYSMPSTEAIDRSIALVTKPRTTSALAPT
jgi:hypothetical protein